MFYGDLEKRVLLKALLLSIIFFIASLILYFIFPAPYYHESVIFFRYNSGLIAMPLIIIATLFAAKERYRITLKILAVSLIYIIPFLISTIVFFFIGSTYIRIVVSILALLSIICYFVSFFMLYKEKDYFD